MDGLTLLLQVHVGLSLIGIASGLVVLYGLLTSRLFAGWTALFLVTTILTSLTGFPLPPFGFDPPRAVGVISLVLLAAAVAGLYVFHLAGAWRRIYIVNAVAALYLNALLPSFSPSRSSRSCSPWRRRSRSRRSSSLSLSRWWPSLRSVRSLS